MYNADDERTAITTKAICVANLTKKSVETKLIEKCEFVRNYFMVFSNIKLKVFPHSFMIIVLCSCGCDEKKQEEEESGWEDDGGGLSSFYFYDFCIYYL